MASVSSLDQDMRKLRLDRYTPAAANEIRKWIEGTLGESLAPGDLMEALRDGVALCKLINLAVSPGVKYKSSSMPFVQMENISHFLKACEMPPLSLPAHDRFLTVDLFDSKDPAQVLQCIAAFSRRANQVNPSAFPNTIGAKSKGGALSPQSSGAGQSPYTPRVVGYTASSPRNDTPPATTFNPLNKSSYSETGRISPVKSSSLSRGGLATGGPVSTWSNKDDETKTAPAWNIHQYGYMGGASQGTQGAFGARRQITSSAPEVPNLAEKEKRLREKVEEEKRLLADNERKLRQQQEADEARAREEEEQRWQEETRRQQREEELAQQQEQARQSREEQVRKDREAEERLNASRARQRTTSDARLNGQFLSQYQAGQQSQQSPTPKLESQATAEAKRIAELERELAELRKQAPKQPEKRPQHHVPLDPSTIQTDEEENPPLPARPTDKTETSHQDDWDASERDYLKKAHQDYQFIAAERAPPAKPPRSLPTEGTRPLPDPTTYQPNTTRTSRFLASNPAPKPAQVASYTPGEAAHSTTAEVDAENARREASQRSTRAGGWASKSLLEREMERERERQREWEENQKTTAAAVRDVHEGSGPGQTWDVHQYGYTGGDSQNRGGAGLGVGGARRQIIGPRPM